MKNFLLTLFVTCFAVSVMAVEIPKQGFGIQIGWAQPILRLNDPSTSVPKDSLMNVTALNGFKIGVVYDASYIAGFGSSMGINYTMAGAATPWRKKSAAQPTQYPQVRDMVMYHEMEIFVDWQYKFEVAKETYLMLYTGPTIQCGIAFNSHTDQRDLDGYITPNISAYQRYQRHEATDDDSNMDLKRLNVTWGVGAGFQYQRYFLRGGYDFGLINPYANQQFVNAAGSTYDRYTRGRFDQWSIKIGMYLWYK